MNPAILALLTNPKKMLTYLAGLSILILMLVSGFQAAFPPTAPVVGDTPAAPAAGGAVTTSFVWLWWIIGAATMLLLGEVLHRWGKLDIRIARTIGIALAVIFTLLAILNLSAGQDWMIPVPTDTDPNAKMTIWLWATTHPLESLGIIIGVGTLVAGLWQWFKAQSTQTAMWLVIIAVSMVAIYWLAVKLLGDRVTVDTLISVGQNMANKRVKDFTDEIQKPEYVFDFGTFIGWAFIAVIISAMTILALKGNKLIGIPLGVAGLILFLVVGGYQAYQLKPVNDAFKAVGGAIGNIEMPEVSLPSLPGFGGDKHEANLQRTDTVTARIKSDDYIAMTLRYPVRGMCYSAQFDVSDASRIAHSLSAPFDQILVEEKQNMFVYFITIADEYRARMDADDTLEIVVNHWEWPC